MNGGSHNRVIFALGILGHETHMFLAMCCRFLYSIVEKIASCYFYFLLFLVLLLHELHIRKFSCLHKRTDPCSG